MQCVVICVVQCVVVFGIVWWGEESEVVCEVVCGEVMSGVRCCHLWSRV